MYDFDKIINRRDTNSYKWDVADGELPMWVADMDFQTAPAIIECLKNRVAHGIYGYPVIPDAWYEAYQSWWSRRHHFEIQKDWLIFSIGVVPIISSAVRKITTPGENVVVLTPAFNIFFNSIENNGRNVLESRLRYENGCYSVDFGDLEEKLKNPQSSLLILCNPHNPTGKVWDRDTLEKIGELCHRYHVVVLSDEIHCDLTLPGVSYIPFAAVSEKCRENSITCIAPTKTFNIAGLQTAAVVVPNEVLRHKIWRGLNTDEVAEGNVFSTEVAIAAFEQGEEWLEELRVYLGENRKVARDYIAAQIPKIKAVEAGATYLLWIDCSEIPMSSEEIARSIRERTGLYVSEGSEYRGDGEHFLRLNMACPRQVLLEGLSRLKEGIEGLLAPEGNGQ